MWELLKQLADDLPTWARIVIICVILAILIFLLILIGYMVLDDRTITIGKLTISGKSEQTNQSATNEYEETDMIGYYYTLDDNQDTVCTEENLTMKSYKDGNKISGSVEAEVHDAEGDMVKRRWIYEGVRHGNDLSLYYITDSPAPTGAGVNYLLSMGGVYSGYWLGVDFPSGYRVQCPYVLVKKSDKNRPNQTCETRWPSIFNEKNECKILKK